MSAASPVGGGPGGGAARARGRGRRGLPGLPGRRSVNRRRAACAAAGRGAACVAALRPSRPRSRRPGGSRAPTRGTAPRRGIVGIRAWLSRSARWPGRWSLWPGSSAHCCAGAPSEPCMPLIAAHGSSSLTKTRRAPHHPYPYTRMSSGPFTTTTQAATAVCWVAASNLSFGSGLCPSSLGRATCPRQRPFGPGLRLYPASYPRTAGGGASHGCPGFLSPFDAPAFACWASCPAGGLGLPYGRLTGPGPDPVGVSTFRTHKRRPGRVPSLPRDGGALPAVFPCPAGAAAFQRPVLYPTAASHRRGYS